LVISDKPQLENVFPRAVKSDTDAEIVLLGRIAAKVGFRIKDSNFGLNRSEIEICRVIAILSRELGRDRIPMSLVFRVLPALEASVSRTIGSLESKGYIKKIYARDKGEKNGRIYLSLTAKGGKASDLVSKYFRTKIIDMLKEVLEPRLPKKGVTKSTLSEGEKILKELRQGLVDNILRANRRAEQKAKSNKM
jgi:DNA-binding MarR family transcriptional regulator